MIPITKIKEAYDWEPTPECRERPQELWDIIMQSDIRNGILYLEDGYEINLRAEEVKHEKEVASEEA